MSKTIIMNEEVQFSSLTYQGFSLGTLVGHPFWLWYEQHKTDVVLQVRFLFFKINVTVAELLPLFEKIFGKKP